MNAALNLSLTGLVFAAVVSLSIVGLRRLLFDMKIAFAVQEGQDVNVHRRVRSRAEWGQVIVFPQSTSGARRKVNGAH